tara:strand:+ start:1059 stop:1361 length:303 start_codon:yes stop_codon:yes gene_type:complete
MDKMIDDFFTFNKDFEFSFDPTSFSLNVCRKICDALDEGKDQCDIVSVGKDDYEFNMIAEESEFLDILEKNISRVEETEDYELCGRILSWINKLKENGKS